MARVNAFTARINFKRAAESLKRKVEEIDRQMIVATNEAGVMLVHDIKKSLFGPRTGRIYEYYDGGQVKEHQSSAAGEVPANWYGGLHDSIRMEQDLDKPSVDVGVFNEGPKYAKDLEFGTTKIEERPFIRPAAERNRKKIVEIYDKAVKKGINKR